MSDILDEFDSVVPAYSPLGPLRVAIKRRNTSIALRKIKRRRRQEATALKSRLRSYNKAISLVALPPERGA